MRLLRQPTLKEGRLAFITMMRRRRGSTHGYAPSEDLETGVRRSGATDRQADGATTRVLQLPPSGKLIFTYSCLNLLKHDFKKF